MVRVVFRWVAVGLLLVSIGLYGASRLVEPVDVPLLPLDLTEMVLVPEGVLPSTLSGASIRVPAFYLDRFEVTERDWRRQYNDLSRLDPSGWAAVDRRGPDFPMRYVNLFEAESFAAAQGKRLPTNQEWERACRGRGGPFPWGRFFREDAANVSEIWKGGTASVLRVGTFEAGCSVAGVYDLVGNVWEWTGSEPVDLLHHSITPSGDLSHLRLSPWTGERHGIVRGGAFSSRLRGRSSFELVEHAAHRSRDMGFRCAISAAEVARHRELVPLIHDLGYRDPWSLWRCVWPAESALRRHGRPALPLLRKTLSEITDAGLASRLTGLIQSIEDSGETTATDAN